MLNLVSLIAVALVSLQYNHVNAQMDAKLDNSLEPNVVPAAAPRRRTIRKFVSIPEAPPETVTYKPGTRMELDCMIMGKPAPSVEWLKNGEPIDNFEEEANEILPGHEDTVARMGSKLVVLSPSNGDEYTCVATSGLKQRTATTTVYTVSVPEEEEIMLLEKMVSMPAKPIITKFYYEVFADNGSDLILPCRIYSFTKAQVFWQDNKNNMVYGDSRMRVLPTGDLLITGLRWSDMGNFTCTAKNTYGKESIATFVYPTKPKA